MPTEQPQDLVTFLWVSLLAVASVCGTLAVLYRGAVSKIHAMQEAATQEAKAALAKEEAASALAEKAAQDRIAKMDEANGQLRQALTDNTEVMNRVLRRLPKRGGTHDNGG